MDKYLKNKKTTLSSETDIEFHEVLLDKLTQKQEEVLGLQEKKIEKPLLDKISFGLLFFTFLLFFILFAQTFYLQVIENENLSALAKRNKFIIQRVQANRGVIYDQSLNQLVFNQPSFDLVLTISELPRDPERRLKIIKEVSEIIGKDINTIKEMMMMMMIEDSELNQLLVLENLSHSTLILLETRISDLSGFSIQRNTIRHYKDGEFFSHLIGYTGKITTEELGEKEGYAIFDWIGRTGVEEYYEDVLRENPGEIRVERDALGNIISKEVISLPEPGKSLVLWLDSDLQKKITQELKKSVENVGSSAGVAIALDPRTGGVLSLVSYPTFDNNLFQKRNGSEELRRLLEDPLKTQPLFNRAISGQYASGSTIKPFIAAAALEEKLITTATRIFSDGKIEVPHRYDPNIVFTFRDFQRQGHGWTDVKKAIAESINTFFYAIGGGYRDQRGLGPDLMKRYLEAFGWGQKTGIDLSGERIGLLPSPSWQRAVRGIDWRLGDSYHFSIGQGNVLVTPLQLAVSTLAIANNGKVLEPQVVKKIISTGPNGLIQTEKEMMPEIIGDELRSSSRTQAERSVAKCEGENKILSAFANARVNQDFISQETLEIVRQGMRQAVTDGTARTLRNLPVKAAAKTGTAETPIANHYHHWVTIFAPYDNPEIVLTIMIENIEGLRAATLPVAREVLNWHFTR